MDETTSKGRIPPATKILLGLVIGAVAGIVANATLGPKHEGLVFFADKIAHSVGQIFLRLLFMVVIPLVFCSLTLGVAGLGDLRNLGRVGGRTIAYFLITTLIAALLGLLLVNVIRPGDAIDPAKALEIREAFSTEASKKIKDGTEGTGFGVATLINVIPKNVVEAAGRGDMLAVIFFALLCGIAATFIPSERRRVFLDFLSGFNEICVVIIRFAMKLAPYGVAGLIFFTTAKFGVDILKSLALYLVTVLSGLLIHQFVVLGIAVMLLARISPIGFFRRCRGLMVTAFSTSSSNATLPTTIRTAIDEFGVPPKIAGFVLPLGATLNMNGTALFEGTAVIFLSQVAGIELGFEKQAIVVALCVISAIGAAGVPGGSLPLLALVMEQVGVPGAWLALILGVDRLVDMTRTVPNVTGDLTAAIYVARAENSLGASGGQPDRSGPFGDGPK